MDTRQKIVPAQVIGAVDSVVLFVCYFDPLCAAHVRRLRQLSDRSYTVVLAIDDPPKPLLPRQARAELAASLAVADYVVTDWQAALATLTNARVHDLRAEEIEYREALSADVIRRHRSE